MRSWTSRLRVLLHSLFTDLPIVVSAMLIGTVVLGAAGGAVGLVLGLDTYAPTAWFAVLEVGVPAGAAGCVLGLAVGLVATWVAGAPASRPPTGPVDDDFAGRPRGW
jgi:hypothetical protein